MKRLFIDREIANSHRAQLIRTRLGLPAETVSDARQVYDAVSAAPDPVSEGKEVLYLTANRGAFVRDCPGTRNYTCCGYRILHIGTYCVMDCAYCVLQAYFHPPVLQFFVNHEEMFTELDAVFAENRISRIGTGEFTDSLIWEDISSLTPELVARFSRQNRAMLELKTKTTAIRKLKDLPHNRKTAAAWSVNTEKVIAECERKTASLSARLRAAAACESWGYPVAFHFDPMIISDGCEEEYGRVVDRIFEHVSPENVLWISLGTFRFMPDLKSIVQRRFADAKTVYGEFIPGLDGKMRYFKPLRISLYQKVADRIRERAPDVTVYFCMEDEAVWRKTMGFFPEEQGGLPRMLDRRAAFICGLDAPTEEI